MTLITIENDEGTYRRCDAKCHNATEPDCRCICLGLFHGKGSHTAELQQAIEKHSKGLVAAMCEEGVLISELADELRQRSLL
jgi:hypothetical protein